MKRIRSRQLVLIVGLVTLAGLVLAACGDNGKNGSDATAKSADVNRYEQELETLYKGNFAAPSGGSVDPPKGKNVWVVAVGLSSESAQAAMTGIRSAGDSLGWEITAFDGKFESSRWLTGIQQALADRADGILLAAIDCAPVKSALEQAKDAGVPVVSFEARDCTSPLYTYGVEFVGNRDFEDWVAHDFGGSQARWVIAQTEGQAKTIVTVQTDFAAGRVTYDPGITDEFEKCPTCEIVDKVEFVGTEFGPPLQAKIEQSLTKHPEADSFIAAYDAVMTGGGGAAALRASGRLDEIAVMGGEGSAPAIELIHDEAGVDACSGVALGWEGYAGMMGLARVFAGQDPYRGDSGIGTQVCDREHNLPPKGEEYEPPVDYAAEYEELWGLK